MSQLHDTADQVRSHQRGISSVNMSSVAQLAETITVTTIDEILNTLAVREDGPDIVRDMFIASLNEKDTVAYDLLIITVLFANGIADGFNVVVMMSDPDEIAQKQVDPFIRLVPRWDGAEVETGQPLLGM